MLHKVIEQKLTEQFSPTHLEVINESYMHNVPEGSESHFKVVIVSNVFENKRLISRHRLVNNALATEFEQGLHALSMHTLTPSEWHEQALPDSPKCMGGGK